MFLSKINSPTPDLKNYYLLQNISANNKRIMLQGHIFNYAGQWRFSQTFHRETDLYTSNNAAGKSKGQAGHLLIKGQTLRGQKIYNKNRFQNYLSIIAETALNLGQ